MNHTLVFDWGAELLGVLHNWNMSMLTGEMDQYSCLRPNSVFPKEAEKCLSCNKFDRCFPKLLVQLPRGGE